MNSAKNASQRWASHHEELDDLHATALRCRRTIVGIATETGHGHLGADLSCIDLLVYLLRSTLRRADEQESPIVLLSKSHAALAYYTVLQELGHLSERELRTFGCDGSALTTVVSPFVNGVTYSSGSLGHGLAVGAGIALADQLGDRQRDVIVLCGDGELQEGSVWEAALFASANRLERLAVVVDRNRSQKSGLTEDTVGIEPLADKWCAFGWDSTELAGHDFHEMRDMFQQPPKGRPRCFIAHTVKGKGVSFMEGDLSWHSGRLSPEQLQLALLELR